MKVYKQTIVQKLKGMALAVFAGVVGFFVSNYFLDNFYVVCGITAAAFLLFAYFALFNENIRFELDRDGRLRYFQNKKLKGEYDIPNCLVGYKRKSKDGDHDITLEIVALDESSEKTYIDCSPLGYSRFYKLWGELDEMSANEKVVLKAK